MMVFVTANDLITMFVGLEVLSLPLYIMTGLARRRRLLSQEAALKYFLLGAFSSAFFLFGSALLYGYAGSSDLEVIATAISTSSGDLEALLLPGVALTLVGLLFKVGAVPFHSWTPDAYQGAPTPVTGFMAACTKVAAFGAILRLTYVGIGPDRWDWEMGVVVVAALTMVVGAVLSVTQTDVKRLLAYSSIAHAGFILVGVLAFSQAARRRRDVLPRRLRLRDDRRLRRSSRWSARAAPRRRTSRSGPAWASNHPVVAGAFAFLLLAFAGIPLTSGFTAEVRDVRARGRRREPPASCSSSSPCSHRAVTAFVYVRLIVLMYFTEASGDEVVALTPSIPSTVAITVGCPRHGARRRHPGARARPRELRLRVPPVTQASAGPAQRGTPSVLELPGASDGLRARLGEGLARGQPAHRGPGRPRGPVHRRGRRAPHRGRGQAVPAAAHAARGRARRRHRRPGRARPRPASS